MNRGNQHNQQKNKEQRSAGSIRKNAYQNKILAEERDELFCNAAVANKKIEKIEERRKCRLTRAHRLHDMKSWKRGDFF